MSAQPVYYLISVNERGFVFSARMPLQALPALGSLVKTPLDATRELVGLIYSIEIQGNEITRALSIHAEQLDPAEIEYHRNRLMPVNVSVLNVGYLEQQGSTKRAVHLPPSRLPATLSEVHPLTNLEAQLFVQHAQPIFERIASFLSDQMVEISAAFIVWVAGNDRARRQQLCRALVLAWGLQLDKVDAVVRQVGENL